MFSNPGFLDFRWRALVKASDFALWAGPRAAHTQNAVTTVPTVTPLQESSIPAAFEPRAAVTTTTEVLVTAVTETEPALTPVPPAPVRITRSTEGHVDDQRARRGDQGD